jgi:hypothetical protein
MVETRNAPSTSDERAAHMPRGEVRHMEGVILEFVPGMGSLAGGILLLAVLVAAVAYAWYQDERSRATAAGCEPLKKAA